MKELEKHLRIFNFIAPVYSYFFRGQVANYRNVIEKYEPYFRLPQGGKVLDIGCGTGALLYSFTERGYRGTGIDFAPSMIRAARKSTRDMPIDFVTADVIQGLPFPSHSFDLVVSSYVLHGLSKPLRQRVFEEASRVTRGLVLFYDYNQKRKILTDLVEWAEGGDYFRFAQEGQIEMCSYFQDVVKYDVGLQTALYLCLPKTGSKTLSM